MCKMCGIALFQSTQKLVWIFVVAQAVHDAAHYPNHATWMQSTRRCFGHSG